MCKIFYKQIIPESLQNTSFRVASWNVWDSHFFDGLCPLPGPVTFPTITAISAVNEIRKNETKITLEHFEEFWLISEMASEEPCNMVSNQSNMSFYHFFHGMVSKDWIIQHGVVSFIPEHAMLYSAKHGRKHGL